MTSANHMTGFIFPLLDKLLYVVLFSLFPSLPLSLYLSLPAMFELKKKNRTSLGIRVCVSLFLKIRIYFFIHI